MKIAFVLGDVSSIGGIERVTSILSDIFVRNGHQVTVISLFRAHESLNYEFNSDVKLEYLTNMKYAIQKQGGITRLLMFFSIIKKFKKLYGRSNYDLFIGQGFPNCWLLWLSGLAARSVACEHVSYNYYNKILKKIRIQVYRSFYRVITLTQNDCLLFNEYLNNVYVIPNPVVMKNAVLSDLSNKRIISVGRLSPEKGYDLLLKISPSIFEKFPDWELWIYGEGPQKEKLIRLRDILQLQDKVYFKGVTPSIGEAYSQASVYVMSSFYEGFGMVLVEAALFGLPIISFDCPNGPRDILKNGRGVLIKTGDAIALQEAIIAMLKDDNLRRYYANRSSEIPAEYSPEKIYALWKEYCFKCK